MSKRFLSVLALTAMLLGLCACEQNSDSSSPQNTPEPTNASGIAVQVEQIHISTISAENKVSGKVEAENETSVMVSANAQVTAVYVETGDIVRVGQALCKLDMASTLASFQAAQISYDSAVQSYDNQVAIFDAQIALAEKNISDLKALFEIGAASQIEIDQAELNLMSAKAQRDSALSQLEAGMQSTIANLEQLTAVLQNVDEEGNVISPASGTIISLSAIENGYVSAQMPVAVIDGVDQMKVTVSVSEALIPKLKIGDEVDVVIGSLNASYVGKIRSIERTANLQTKLYNVSISVPSNLKGILAGMFADVTFRTDTSSNTIVIPTEAILTSGNTQYVYVVENNSARYIEITTGLTGNGVTEVTSGLEAEMQLVTVGQSYLSDGQTVRIVSGVDADNGSDSPDGSQEEPAA